MRGKPLSQEFIDIVSRDGWRLSEVADYFKRYLSILDQITNLKGDNIFIKTLERDGYIQGRFIEAIPQNIICTPEKKYHLTHTKWQATEDISIIRLLSRSILWQLFEEPKFGQCGDTKKTITRQQFIIKILSLLDLEDKLPELPDILKSESMLHETLTENSIKEFMNCSLDLSFQTEKLPLTLSDINKKILDTSQLKHAANGKIANPSQSTRELTLILNEQDNEIDRLRQDIISIYNSSSWRVTAPLRWSKRQLLRAQRFGKLPFYALELGGGFKPTLRKALNLYRQEGISGLYRGIDYVCTRTNTQKILLNSNERGAAAVTVDCNDYSEWIRRYDTLNDITRNIIRKHIAEMEKPPLISVVMPTYNPNPKWLTEAIESVRKQLYPHWELCIADDASPDPKIRPLLEKFAREDARIKIVLREKNGHISAASNSALQLASGDWIALLDHDDLLAENALYYVAASISQNPSIQMIYSDEDKINEAGHRHGPYFKCDWNIDLFYSHNMFSHLGVYRKVLLDKIGGFRLGFEGSQDYDLALRCIEEVDASAIHHIPRVLYHWRVHPESTACGADAKPYAMLAGEKALNEHFKRRGILGRVEFIGYGYRAFYELPQNPPLVSLIIPTRNSFNLVRQCIKSIIEKTTYKNYEIIIVDNGSQDADVLTYFEEISKLHNVFVLRNDSPFNYSALNNYAVKVANGEVIGLINNDIEVISPEWLSEMLSLALQPNIGAVGAKLFYPNKTVQHAGIIIGLGGVAGHPHQYIKPNNNGYFARAALINSFSAVTAACLLIKKSIYEEAKGLNEKDLTVAFNDVDFCLRVRELGYRNVFTPYAELYHHESATRGPDDNPEKQARFKAEINYMEKRWNDIILNDPAYSPNLTLEYSDFSLAWPPRSRSMDAKNKNG